MDEKTQRYRRRVNRLNAIVVLLQRIGIAVGPIYLLTVPGRRSGKPRTAPIAVVPIAGGRYIVQAHPRAAWVANARNAETAELAHGRRKSTVRLVDVPVEERRPLLREHIENSPARVGRLFVSSGLVTEPTPEAVAAAADRIAVFRVESA